MIRILGIDFRTDGPDLPALIEEAGLVVVPSGPGLAVDLLQSTTYRQALRGADWVIPDSGLMVLVWNALHAFAAERRIQRYSGLRLLREVLPLRRLHEPEATFWIMPSAVEQTRNLAWLRENGYPHLTEEHCYVAPFYQVAASGAVEDPELLARLEARRPKVIFLNIGGGTQEPLGWYLRRHLSFRPTILCTGAAIAFLTGGQATIPPWADRHYLGWLLRILREPGKFSRRYWNSVGLVGLIVRHRASSPVPGEG